jgi:hypothetical protein
VAAMKQSSHLTRKMQRKPTTKFEESSFTHVKVKFLRSLRGQYRKNQVIIKVIRLFMEGAKIICKRYCKLTASSFSKHEDELPHQAG